VNPSLSFRTHPRLHCAVPSASRAAVISPESTKCSRHLSGSIAKPALSATHSTAITYGLQISIIFHNRLNLVRDQGVGGSNPLSPTNLFKHLVLRFSNTWY